MKKIPLFLLLAVLLTGCRDNDLIYLEPEPVITDDGTRRDSFGTPFSYTPSEDSPNDIHQSTRVFTAELLFYGDQLYFPIQGILYRFNTVTGNITSACSDPLCDHDSEACPFWNLHTVSSICSDQIYYKKFVPDYANRVKIGPNKWETPIKVESWVYDISSQRMTQSSREYQESSLRYANEYCTETEEFYFDMIQDMETGEWSKALKVYDRQTGTNRTIRHVKEDPDTVITMEKEGKLLYCDSISIGWLDTRTGEKTAIYEGTCGIVSADAEYMYFLREGSLWQMNHDGSNLRALGIDGILTDYNVTEEYIYFRYDHPVDFGLKKIDPLQAALGAPKSRIVLNGMEIWRADKDGGNLTRVYAFAEENDNMTIDDMIVRGNYIYGYWTKANDGETYYSKNDTDTLRGSLLRIDMTTGELYYIEVPK